MSKISVSNRLRWGALVIPGLAIPALLLFVRLRLICPILDLGPLSFFPLWGVVSGRDLQLFARVMHNLTHPAVLPCYAVALCLFALQSVDSPLTEESSQLRYVTLVLVHLTFLGGYLVALLLPMGDLVAVISR